MMRQDGSHPLYWSADKYQPPSDWDIRPIKEYATLVKGKMPSVLIKEPTPASLPYLLIDGLGEGETLFTEETHLPIIEESDTAVVSDGSRSGLAIRGVRGILGSTLLAYRVKEGFDPDYLYYVLESLYPYNNTATIGGAIPHLDKRLLARLPLATPKEDEQRRIAAALKLADEAIAKARAELEATRELKRSLEASLLTGFLDRRSRPRLMTKAGEFPFDWEIKPLKTVAAIDSGLTLNQDRAPKEYPCRYITVAHVQRGKVSSDDPRYLELFPGERETRLLNNGDLLVVEGHANSCEIGRAAMFMGFDEPVTYQNHLFRIRPDTSQLLPKFLLYILNSVRMQIHWNAICNTSSGLNTINRRNLRNILIQFPDVDEQMEILSVLEGCEMSVGFCIEKLAALENVKKSLLQNLLTGKIRIPEGVIHD